jgi:hypothetical protein
MSHVIVFIVLIDQATGDCFVLLILVELLTIIVQALFS